MNKEQFIKELERVTGLDNNQCVIINSIMEDHFIIGRKNKEEIIINLEEQLNISKEEAEKIYESAMSILGEAIKDKLKHPFKSKD